MVSFGGLADFAGVGKRLKHSAHFFFLAGAFLAAFFADFRPQPPIPPPPLWYFAFLAAFFDAFFVAMPLILARKGM